MAQTLVPDIQQRLWAALPPGWKEHMETQQTGAQWFQHAAFTDLVLRGDRPTDLNQTQPAVLWPYSIRSDGRLSSQDWCPHLDSGGLESRIVIPWDTART